MIKTYAAAGTDPRNRRASWRTVQLRFGPADGFLLMLSMIAGYVLGTKAASRAGAMGVVSDCMVGRGTVRGSVSEIDALNERVDRLLLVTEALWTLVKKDGHTDEELTSLIIELDGSDGNHDHRKIAAPVVCPSCGSKVSAGFAKCQICGTKTGFTPGPLDGI